MSQEFEVGVRLSYKVNTGDFENTDVEVSFKTIVEGGKPEAVAMYNKLHAAAWDLLVDKTQEVREGLRQIK